jgi:hypothetical protein
MREVLGPKLSTAVGTARHARWAAIGAAAVCRERRVAVRADDPKVLEPVVRRDSVDVIQDERHLTAVPDLALAAELTVPCLDTGRVETLLEVAPVVGGVLDQHGFKGRWFASNLRGTHCIRIEVLHRDPPQRDVLLNGPGVATRRPQAQATENLRVAA